MAEQELVLTRLILIVFIFNNFCLCYHIINIIISIIIKETQRK